MRNWLKLGICSLLLVLGFGLFSSPSFASQKTFEWSGYQWNVTESKDTRWGAGNNLWSSNKKNVWVDKQDRLHLKITYRNGKWYCPEIYSEDTFGYGTYRFYMESKLDQLNENAVLGLFTYDNYSSDKVQSHYREIDIEFSKWGYPDNPFNSSFTVQPYTMKGNTTSFNSKLSGDYTVHEFNWQPSSIDFVSLHGHNPYPLMRKWFVIHEWNYKGKDIPKSKKEKVMLNLWLLEDKIPSDKKEIEVIIKKFEFIK